MTFSSSVDMVAERLMHAGMCVLQYFLMAEVWWRLWLVGESRDDTSQEMPTFWFRPFLRPAHAD